MKKSLLALAVLGAFAGVASAQTNVTLYGVVDAGIGWNDDGDDKTWSLDSGNNAASRFGIKGTEDLGNGLKGVFVVESGFNADEGTLASSGKPFNRQAWVGLNGGFGEVRLGRQATAFKTAVDTIDPFGGAGQLAIYDAAGYVPGAAGFEGTNLWVERADNVLSYSTPNFSGFTGSVNYIFGEAAGSTSENRQLSAQLGYANGPLNVQFGYHHANDAAVEFDSLIDGVGDVTIDTDKIRTAFLGATYDFGIAKAHAGFGETRVETDVTDKVRNYMLGVTVPFGASKLMASYIRNDVRDLDEGKSDQIGLGYVYSMSKRTALYAQYAHIRNDDAANLGVATAGENGNRVAVGVTHKF